VADKTRMIRYTQRIERRLKLWWGKLRQWGKLRTYRDALHRLRERHTVHRRSDPEYAWRCCEFWQRTLIGKWNSREFASKHGCQVPALYWRGYGAARVPFDAMPPNFVIRPLWLANQRGVYVVAGGRELMRGESATPTELRARLRRSRELSWTMPIMVEEFVGTSNGAYRLPLEYKCHAFGDSVAAVEMVVRTHIYHGGAKGRFYTPEWEPFHDPMNIHLPLAEISDAPPFLDEMLTLAKKLGAAIGTYMRIDFFAGERGCLFNEFSSTPRCGSDTTPYCDEVFGALWEEKLPHAT